MANTRVLLIESGRFIGGVIHSLFERCEKITVIEAHPQDSIALMSEVDRVMPEVVVLDDTLKFDYLDDLLAYLRKANNFRIIIVDTGANQVEVYQKSKVPVLKTDDFITIIG